MIQNGSESPERVRAFTFTRTDIAFLAFISLFLYLQLFILPATPIYVENDQVLPISNAMRLLDGEVMYRDFFHFAPPGADLYYAAVFSIFGAKVWVVNATIFLLAAGQLLILFTFSKRIFPSAFCYLPSLIYFTIGFRLWGIDGSYRLFSIVFVMAAALFVAFRRDSKAIIAAAALCGISSFFVQTRGLLGVGAIGLFLLWEQYYDGFEFKPLLRKWAIAAATFLLVVAATQSYMAWLGGFDNYFFANVIFLKDHYGADTLSNTFAYFSDVPDLNSYLAAYGVGGGWFRYLRVAGPTLFFYALIPLVFVVFFLYRRSRRAHTSVDRDLVLLTILGSVLYIGASAPTAFRLYHISIPGVVVLTWLLSRMPFGALISRAATAVLLILSVMYCFQRQTIANVTLELPAGSAVFLAPDTVNKYVWLAAETEPGDYLYEAQHATYYFPLHLKNPTPFYLIRDNNYTPPFQVEQLMRSLRTNPPRLIAWHGGWSKEPAERLPGDNLAPLWEFVRSNYRLKKEFLEQGEFTVNSRRDIEFWERIDDGAKQESPSPSQAVP
jgi:hypothetical protein